MAKAKDTGHVFDTPDGIELYRLASIKGRIKLESAGIKFGGKSSRKIIAGELGLKPTDTHDRFLTALQVRIDALKAKILRDRLTVEERGHDWMVMSCDRSALVMLDLYQTDKVSYNVFFYMADKPGDAKEKVSCSDIAQAMDIAEAWVLEVR